jgi:hypothetical protein
VVSEHERHRNQAIIEKQGNRNLLSDFPNWGDRIDSTLGLGTKPDTETPMADDRIYLNGIDALTGQYLVSPMPLADAAARARGTPPPAEHAGWLQRIAKWVTGKFFALPVDVDPAEVSQAGWAVVFGPDASAKVRRALEPLIEHRRKQVPPDRCKVLEFKRGETRESWLARHGAAGANVEPTCVPYYVLLVGGPDSIPFDFQFLLDVDYAVGRLAFDNEDDYGRYVQAVVAYETDGVVANGRELVFWGTRHDGDPATELSSDDLVRPLFKGVPAGAGAAIPPIADKMKFKARCLVGDGEATKANLLEVLHSRTQKPPSFLFTASHGMGWPKGDARQRAGQGGLLCQDWPGFGRIKPDHYLTAKEVEADARLQGLVAFVFACYGAGTPRHDPFLRKPEGGPVEVADAPFVSALGQRLLGGGALAVIGHVERAWGYSIQPPGIGPQVRPFWNLMGRILGGEPVGHATMDFSQRFATASADLLNKLAPTQPGALAATDASLVLSWIDRNDAMNYVVLGDPAVRLRTDDLK